MATYGEQVEEIRTGAKKKCISCGFLAIQPSDSDVTFYEIGVRQRIVETPAGIVCFRRHIRMDKEISAALPNDETQDLDLAIKLVLTKKRNCQRWARYEPGFNARDQLQEYRLQIAEKNRTRVNIAMFIVAVAAVILAAGTLYLANR